MRNRLNALLEWIGDVFWAVPALLAAAGVVLAELALRHEPPDGWPRALAFAGDAAGARSLLGVIAGSAIGVAGTIFSITIAALSLTSGQMGPRLLRNFLRDAGNKRTLGLFLLTFAFCISLQRGMGAGVTPGVPQLGLTMAVALALICTAALAWFVHHVASGINVETVIGLVQDELTAAVHRLTVDGTPQAGLQLAEPPPQGVPLRCAATGYLRAIDYDDLADWAARHKALLSVLVRPGDFLHPASRIAEVMPATLAPEAAKAVRGAMTLGSRPAAAQDLEFAVRQLVEVAVRALSPGINDPFTAIAVLDRLGAALSGLAGRFFPPAAMLRDERVVLHRRVITYRGLCDAMFHLIRQAGSGQAAVLIRMVEVIDEALDVEAGPDRREHLRRHVGLVREAGRKGITDSAGLADLEARVVATLGRG